MTRGPIDLWRLKESASWRVELVVTPIVVAPLDLEAVKSAVNDVKDQAAAGDWTAGGRADGRQ